MKTIATISLLLLATTCHALNADRLADAIFKAEGADKAKVPYGILSVPVRSQQEARQVCLRTIATAARGRTDRQRIRNLAAKYCPKSADPRGNKNWIYNVTWIYEHSK